MDKAQVQDTVKKYAADADKFVRENPWAAVAAAALIGFVLGSMRAKKNGDGK